MSAAFSCSNKNLRLTLVIHTLSLCGFKAEFLLPEFSIHKCVHLILISLSCFSCHSHEVWCLWLNMCHHSHEIWCQWHKMCCHSHDTWCHCHSMSCHSHEIWCQSHNMCCHSHEIWCQCHNICLHPYVILYEFIVNVLNLAQSVA